MSSARQSARTSRDVSCDGIEALIWKEGSTEWRATEIRHYDRGPSRQSLEEIDHSDVTVFISPHLDRILECRACTGYLGYFFDFHPDFFEPAFLDSNGYFGYDEHFNNSDEFTGLSTYSRFLIQRVESSAHRYEPIRHRWKDIITFTHWNSVSRTTRILFLRTDRLVLGYLRDRLLRSLRQQGRPVDPLWAYMYIVGEYANLQHRATFALRDQIKHIERRSESPRHMRPAVSYAGLHNVARLAMLISEILSVNIKTMDDMLACHKTFMEGRTPPDPRHAATRRKLYQRLLAYAHLVHSMHCRTSSYVSRVKNEIDLIMNVVAQDEARASLFIAKAAKRDGLAMMATSLVGLLCLPLLVMSALFSTTFFDFGADSGSWRLSQKLYILFAFTVPLTVGAYWSWWHWWRRVVPRWEAQVLAPTAAVQTRVDFDWGDESS